MAESAPIPPGDRPAQKPRVKAAKPYQAPLPEPAHITRPPLWRRPWFLILCAAAAIAVSPVFFIGCNLARPDAAPAPRYGAGKPRHSAAIEGALGGFAAGHTRLLAEHPEFDADIAAGAAFDAAHTPAYVAAADKLRPANLDLLLAAGVPTARIDALAKLDDLERARLALLRDEAQSESDSARMRVAHARRLSLCRALLISASDPEAFDTALDYAAQALAELRDDFPRLRLGLETDPALLRALADFGGPLPAEVGAAVAAGFDARLDIDPDAALRLSERGARDPIGGDSFFGRLCRFGHRPQAHRAKISALLGRFGTALSKPSFAEARRALAPADHDAGTVRFASALFRAETLRRLSGDNATEYFWDEFAAPTRAFELRLLKLSSLANADDAYGEALLLHRRAALERLTARFARLRFDAIATAYALALDYRRATAPDHKWPKDTENLFAGLLDTYPADPFTEEPVAYSRKRLHLRSPGADGVERGGIEEPEYAGALAQLWEPTLPLEPDPGPNAAAFGLRPSDFDKPVPRPWEIPKPVGEGY